jgi:hypothetical protein
MTIAAGAAAGGPGRTDILTAIGTVAADIRLGGGLPLCGVAPEAARLRRVQARDRLGVDPEEPGG